VIVEPPGPGLDDVGDEPPVDWTPPAPRPAFDPLTAPLEQVQALQQMP